MKPLSDHQPGPQAGQPEGRRRGLLGTDFDIQRGRERDRETERRGKGERESEKEREEERKGMREGEWCRDSIGL